MVTRDDIRAAHAPLELDCVIEITRVAKKGGPLTKKISLDRDGKLVSDASKCLMNRGTAHRASLDNIAALAPSSTRSTATRLSLSVHYGPICPTR
jgi:hypothetical protein